ncbi:uncharacterized protein [Misgurnus anguillicaudatus]|uniref:uncharacterized protein isoform X1 n=1 Tax=Misgurnus anguillicaudatus TaxID=75329 RepID=UPI003CCF015F
MESVFSQVGDKTKMEQEISSFKSIRAKFQEEIMAKNRPLFPEKPKRLSTLGRSGFINITSGSTVETKPPGLPRVIFREDRNVPSGKWPVSFSSFSHTTPEDNRCEDGGNRPSYQVRHLPLVLPLSSEPKPDSAAPLSKGITSPLRCIKKPMPAPYKPAKISLSGKDIGKFGHTEEHTAKALNPGPVEVHQATVSNPGSQCPSPDHPSTSSPSESLTGSSPSSVSQFFDQHVISTLEKAKRKLSHKNLLVCGRPKGFYLNKSTASTDSPPSPTESESSHPETVLPARGRCPFNGVPVYASTSPLKVNKTSHSTITYMKLNGVTRPEKDHSPVRKPLPDLKSLGLVPLKPPRPPNVNLGRYTTQGHFTDSSETHTTERKPESEFLATRNATLENPTPPPPEFPDFDTCAPDTNDSNPINIAALELEATECLHRVSDSLPPPTLPDEDDGLRVRATLVQVSAGHVGPKNTWSGELHSGSVDEESRSVEALPYLQSVPPPETVTADLGENGSHAAFNLSSEQQLTSEPNSSLQEHFHETCENVYEDVEAAPKFPFSQNSKKRKGAPKNPYADNGHVKVEGRRSMWLVTPWSSSEDQNGQTQHDSTVSFDLRRKDQPSPEHHDEKEQKKKEKQRLEREKKEQKEKEKKRNEMHKKFKITGQEEPMYQAKVLVASKLRKHDLPVKSGDVISIIRTINCPKGKWLARDANNKYGYISVMNVELNIKEMLELGKRASQAAGRGQTDGDNISFSSRSSQHNPVLTSSFTDDSEEWTCDEETLSPSAENLSQNRAVSMPDVFYSNFSTHHTVSDGSMEDIHPQHEALQKLAVFFQNGHENLITTTEDEACLPSTDDPSFLEAVDEPPYLEVEDFQFADIDLLPPPPLYADSL